MHTMTHKGMLREGALKDKVIVITGGGTGLGRAMGEYFLELGAKLAICGRRAEVLAKAAQEMMAEKGSEVFTFPCDVRKYEEVEAFRDAVLSHYGKVDVLLNNAAGNFISPTERLSPGAFDAIIDIVLKGTKNCTLAFGKKWIENKEQGKVVLSITTTYAATGSAFVVPSAMAKAGVSAMTRSLAVEWARYGIRFNAIAPGPFPTEGAWSRLLPGDIPDMLKLENQVPLKRAGNLHELANLAAFLVSDFAAYMNGEIVTIDGGEWLLGAGELNFLEAVPDEMWDWIGEATRKGK
ncbi:SDR family oxidoreductase [Croceimicrobium sp.]|uniref:SDR family oxidoreductase n=1 Tax=Croceimicrobium sp. TaxID=2828340 RepID=UPI003BA9E3C8